MVAKQAQLAAGRAGRVVFDGSAVDVTDFLADGGAGNRDTEFDGSADGIGDEVGSLQYGSCGGRGRCREPSSSQHRTLYILCLTRSPVDRLMHSRSGRAVLPQARTVMDPFHVVHLAAEKLTVCRQRIQQVTLGHRGRSGDPLYGIKRVLLTRKVLRTDKQKARLEAVFADEQHIDVEVTEHLYQDLVAAYCDPDKRTGKLTMFKTLKRIKSGVLAELAELAQLGRSLWKRRKEILAYFDTGASNGPVEAINGRLEHLRGIALGFRNLDHYILRSLIHSGQLRERINAL